MIASAMKAFAALDKSCNRQAVRPLPSRACYMLCSLRIAWARDTLPMMSRLRRDGEGFKTQKKKAARERLLC